MATVLRACAVCGTPSTGTRCPAHAIRRTTTARGYGRRLHRRIRAALLPAAIGTPCPICGVTMRADQPLELDHSEPLSMNPYSLGDRIVHRRCNRARRP